MLILLDSLAVTAIDIIMDPVIVNSPDWKIISWEWTNGGSYFGVPLGNFVGWFIVAMIVSTTYRSFEYMATSNPTSLERHFYILPVIGYGVLILGFCIKALELQLYEVAFIGLSVSLPLVIINFFLFAIWLRGSGLLRALYAHRRAANDHR